MKNIILFCMTGFMIFLSGCGEKGPTIDQLEGIWYFNYNGYGPIHQQADQGFVDGSVDLPYVHWYIQFLPDRTFIQNIGQHRTGKYDLQPESKNLILIYDDGDQTVFPGVYIERKMDHQHMMIDIDLVYNGNPLDIRCHRISIYR